MPVHLGGYWERRAALSHKPRSNQPSTKVTHAITSSTYDVYAECLTICIYVHLKALVMVWMVLDHYVLAWSLHRAASWACQ